MASDDRLPLTVRLTAAQLDGLDRFARERGVSEREHALGLLLDVALEATSGTGRRYWDNPVRSVEAPIDGARTLAERLRGEGHADAADRLHEATAGSRIGHALLEALREACQTVLTTVEALDPKTQLLAEELRLEIDKRLST